MDFKLASDDTAFEIHAYKDGGDSWGSAPTRKGAFWSDLTSQVIEVFRESDDDHADYVMVRLWRTAETTVFSDGFESGDTTRWSVSTP